MVSAANPEIATVPAARLEAERELSTGLPSLGSRCGPVLGTVDWLAFGLFGSTRCSDPMILIGTKVKVINTDGWIQVVDNDTSEIVADYCRRHLSAAGEN